MNRSAAGGSGGGDGKRWCRTGSKLNSKSANGTGGESIVTVLEWVRSERVRTRPSKLAVVPDRHRRRWRPKRPSLTTSKPSPTSSSRVNNSNSNLRLPNSSRTVKLISSKITLLLAEGKVCSSFPVSQDPDLIFILSRRGSIREASLCDVSCWQDEV